MWFYFNIFFALLTGDWKIFQQSNLEKKETLFLGKYSYHDFKTCPSKNTYFLKILAMNHTSF